MGGVLGKLVQLKRILHVGLGATPPADGQFLWLFGKNNHLTPYISH